MFGLEGTVYVCVCWEEGAKTVSAESQGGGRDVIELGMNFDLKQFSKNFECDCESGSCSICAEIDYVLQPDSKLITYAINCEFDDQAVELNENAGAVTKEFMIDEGECTATSWSEPETMDEFHNVVAWHKERAQGSRAGAAEASAMEDDEDNDEDAFEDAENDEEEEDIDDNTG
ncbi:hypothetical protein LR48_Vigan08g053900 [Vigna angularis]|uniref:Uncharacterized protein n=1 Tax=Phaseolus angularis TaxID=3914 RepID=A0A0L9V443_PHAAN|nr:hypothetical protein LR48_Vigan08g053900 [Vigna angularis]